MWSWRGVGCTKRSIPALSHATIQPACTHAHAGQRKTEKTSVNVYLGDACRDFSGEFICIGGDRNSPQGTNFCRLQNGIELEADSRSV